MHNRALHDTLAAFVEEAAWQLAEEVSGGAEIPFELINAAPSSRGAAPLYCYRPQTQRFLAERAGALGRLPSYVPAIQGLMALPDLEQLPARPRPAPAGPGSPIACRRRAAGVPGSDVGGLDRVRVQLARASRAAFAELEEAVYEGCELALVVTPVEGLVIESEEVALGEGLRLVRGIRLQDAPPELRADEYATVAVLTLEGEGPSLEQAGRRLRRLQTALRLWDDAEPALGPTAWARTDGAPWLAIPLATGLRRPSGDCLLASEEEDPLRAFCSLIARRTPRAGELAWALRRFELGCERSTALEALTDWLLSARALLAEPDAAGYERLSERMAAICAVPGEREELATGLHRAIAMERGAVAGIVRPDPAVEAIVGSLGSCLRAILRDVLCGHLDAELRRVADELLADVAPASAPAG